MKRREFIAAGGAATVLAAGGATWRAHDRGVWHSGRGPAYEPWYDWREGQTGAGSPLSIVRAGLLASNPHNTQPWLFRLQHGRVELYADMRRHLGAFDPYRREMFLGLGCALENMMLAARATGYRPTLSLVQGRLDPPPAGSDPVAVASIALEPAEPQPSELHDAIGERHTNRGPYDVHSPIAGHRLDMLQRSAREEPDVGVVFATEPDARRRMGRVIVEATEAIVGDSEMVHDSERWYRHTRSEIEQHRDGPTLDATGLSPLRIAVARLLPRPSAEDNHTYWLDNTRQIHVATAPVFGMIVVRDLYDREQTLRAGRAWQRMHLLATTQGLAMQPLNQPVEWVDRDRSLGRASPTVAALAALSAGAAGEPTFVFRAGYPVRSALPSPRRPAAHVIM